MSQKTNLCIVNKILELYNVISRNKEEYNSRTEHGNSRTVRSFYNSLLPINILGTEKTRPRLELVAIS
jgi:hypothetical protein